MIYFNVLEAVLQLLSLELNIVRTPRAGTCLAIYLIPVIAGLKHIFLSVHFLFLI